MRKYSEEWQVTQTEMSAKQYERYITYTEQAYSGVGFGGPQLCKCNETSLQRFLVSLTGDQLLNGKASLVR